MGDEVEIKQYGLTIEFSGDAIYGTSELFEKSIAQQIQAGVADAAAKFEEDFFLPGQTIEKKMNAETIEELGMQPNVGNIRVRTAEESLNTPEDNVEIYKDGEWSIRRNKYLGLYICHNGNALMFLTREKQKEMKKVPGNIRTKWKFLCEMEK